ncbi:MAG: MOSC domain-containing protein [Pirellulales bacterium]
MTATVLSVNVGTKRVLDDGGGGGGGGVMTAIFKLPQHGPVALGKLGLAGDQQADLCNHGGPDKAVNVYAVEHFAEWSRRLGQPLGPGAFGENLTTEQWREEEVCIGDVYQVGTAVVQVTQPRQPCHKLALKWSEPQLVRWVVQSGKTGFYLRCLEPGLLEAESCIERIERPTPAVTIAEAHRTMHFSRHDACAVERLRAAPGLSRAWLDALTGGA